jgi:hypothetical protein
MDNTKEKSAVGTAIPATEIEKVHSKIIAEFDGKIKT